MEHLGATANWQNVGQVYPRSLDFEVVSILVRLSAAPSSFAKTLRIMAGHELLGGRICQRANRILGDAPQNEQQKLRKDQWISGNFKWSLSHGFQSFR
jgi:hypothetical protein